MKRAAAGFAVLIGLSSAAAVAATSSSTPASRPAPAVSSLTYAVGPGSSGSVQPAVAAPPASSGGSASVTVSGVVQSSAGVQIRSSQPSYQGTDPAQMTVSRAGSQVTVTVSPR